MMPYLQKIHILQIWKQIFFCCFTDITGKKSGKASVFQLYHHAILIYVFSFCPIFRCQETKLQFPGLENISSLYSMDLDACLSAQFLQITPLFRRILPFRQIQTAYIYRGQPLCL